MITLYTFGPAFGCPDPSPFVMKAEMLLKLSGMAYEARRGNFRRAPKGKLPIIHDGERVVADSTLIRLYLERQYGIDFDRGLSVRDRGVAWGLEKMLEDHLYWQLVYWRWLVPANFERGPRQFFDRLPAWLRPVLIPLLLRRVRRNLHAQGVGRFSIEEKTLLGDRCLEALSQVLGDQPYLLGDRPCGADATAFAFLAATLPAIIESPLRDKLLRTPNLLAYHDRLRAEFFPAFVPKT